MTTRLHTGIIGLGAIWRMRHKPALLKLQDRFQVVAVCDVNEQQAKAEAASLGCDYTPDWRELLARPDLDAIHLLTPPDVRLEVIRDAANRGKAVYCEKPLALTLAEAAEVVRVVKESGIVYTSEFVRRFFPVSRHLKNLLQEKLGEPRLIVGESHGAAVGGPGHWMRDQVRSGGYTMDFGVHLIDIFRWVFGHDATAVQAFGGRYSVLDHPINDIEATAIEFGADKAAHLLITRAVPGEAFSPAWKGPVALDRPEFVIYCEKGLAIFEPMKGKLAWQDASGGGQIEEPLPGGPQFVLIGEVMNANFHRFAIEGVKPEPDVVDGYKTIEVVFYADAARREGRRLEIPGGS